MLSAPSSSPRASEPNELLIHARPDDSLLWSLPLWMLGDKVGLSVRLEAVASAGGRENTELLHLPPSVMLGGQHLTQLLTIIETLHERFPLAGIWPESQSARIRSRDACAGLIMLCHASSGGARPSAVAPLPDLIANVALRVRDALDDDAQGAVASVAVAAALTAQARDWPAAPIDNRLIALSGSPAVSNWLREPQIQARAIWTTEWKQADKFSCSGVLS